MTARIHYIPHGYAKRTLHGVHFYFADQETEASSTGSFKSIGVSVIERNAPRLESPNSADLRRPRITPSIRSLLRHARAPSSPHDDPVAH